MGEGPGRPGEQISSERALPPPLPPSTPPGNAVRTGGRPQAAEEVAAQRIDLPLQERAQGCGGGAKRSPAPSLEQGEAEGVKNELSLLRTHTSHTCASRSFICKGRLWFLCSYRGCWFRPDRTGPRRPVGPGGGEIEGTSAQFRNPTVFSSFSNDPVA